MPGAALDSQHEKPVYGGGSANGELNLADEPSLYSTSLDSKPYNSALHEDRARRYIAYMLIGLLWLIVGAILILVGFRAIPVSEVKEFAVILGPVVTLVSAATGFYYGTKNSSK